MDDPQNPRDFNKLVEDLGEESAKVELLRKQHLEREEKQLRSKKRMRQAMLDRKAKQEQELLLMKRIKTEVSEQGPATPSKSLNASFSHTNVFASGFYGA